MSGPAVRPVDQDQRDAAVAERERNVVMEAGAGTGKTSTLVRRLVALVAPAAGLPPLSMRRIAAITFTRRAAGELSLRIREELLQGLTEAITSERRLALLRQALTDLDTAYVGTIHSFADRLLRMRPVESRLSPSYEVVEDEEELVDETYQLLLRGAEQGTLASILAGTRAEGMAEEAGRTVIDLLGAGIRAETRETAFAPSYGLDTLVQELIRHRDVPLVLPEVTPPDLTAVRGYMQEFIGLAAPVAKDSAFGRWLEQMSARLTRLMAATDPLVLFTQMAVLLEDRRKNPPKKGEDCDGDNAVWRVWKALVEGGKHRDAGDMPLLDDLTGALRGWLGRRLVRLSPVVVALYEQVKARRGVIDQVDLLLKLRDLLRDHREARGFYQSLFDHLLVDEFQDTDPLQAEIVQFLCERTPVAAHADEVELAPGRLTVVGDPKQSIYRFRRADVAMYDRVTRKLAPGSLQVHLEANFRSVPTLTAWFNARFPDLLGQGEEGETFDPETGQVYHRDLGAGRQDDRTPAVHVLPFELAAGQGNAAAYRALEAEALASYLRWLVEESNETTAPRGTGEPRPLRYEDISVLAITTTNLPLLFDQLDRFDVPYAASGGTLFLSDPLHQLFLLGLRAIADPDDGVAQAALLRPPFFAVDLRDLFERQGPAPQGSGQERVQAAAALVADLRARRLTQSPGSTARELLERTAFGRTVALGPNGGQRLQRLRELCHLLELTAAESRLDYDGATAELRQWVTDPPKQDPPRPVAESAVQVMTVHQAKGLEFPVVVLWDGQALLAGRNSGVAWKVAPGGTSWSLALDGLKASEPAGVDLTSREKQYLEHERRRLVYVAATRDRDLLVVPQAGTASPKHICGLLLGDADPPGVERLGVYQEGKGAPWSVGVRERVGAPPVSAVELEQELEESWAEARKEAGKARFKPVWVSKAAQEARTEEEEEDRTRWQDQQGRYGRVFGTVVHRALEQCVRSRELAPATAVKQAMAEVGFREQRDEAIADVARGLAALDREGLLGEVGPTLRLEYPVAGPGDRGELLLGYVDLVRASQDGLVVIDYKTDRPPEGPAEEATQEYAEQVRIYGRLLAQSVAPPGTKLRCGLLYTADGTIRWVT